MRLVCIFLFLCATLAAQTPGPSGEWIVTVTVYDEPDVMRLTLEPHAGGVTGKIWGDVQLEGTVTGSAIEFKCSYEDDKAQKSCGQVSATFSSDAMTGKGTIFDDPVEFTAKRAAAGTSSPRTHEFLPTHFYRQFSGTTEPVLHINAGDTVKTKCVDAGGTDEKGAHRSHGGNPLTGPFYVENALPGDTLAITLKRVRLNRDSAGIFNDTVVGSAVGPYYFRDLKRVKDFDSSWKLDREAGTATLSKPTDHLRNLKVPLTPMMGCIGVAPSNRQAYQSGNLGNYGGNMDYNQIREGTTVYLPVFQTGALLYVGDGHATQGDGELTGNALETSMDVEFTVDLIRGKSLGQPRFENGEYVMVSGIGGSLTDALQEATTGLSRWLEDTYKLNPGEIAMLLGSSMRYDVAEIVDPKVHVVAKLPKSILSQIIRSE
jgi:acetamidase/formamidase